MPPMPARPSARHLLRALGRRLPRTRGTLRIDGPSAPITIARDRWGIPHIEAGEDADAWFALGFCHGQDRSFQLELIARAGRGRLAELLGPPGLPLDRLSRTIGFRRLAQRQVPVLDADVRATLETYAAGVNAAAAVTPRPHELVLLRGGRVRWTVEDVLAFLGLQSLALAGNWDVEIARLRILIADGPEALRAAVPAPADRVAVESPVGFAAGAALDRLGADLASLRDVVGGAGGSNAWALAGEHTASGAPILANDPHLGPSVPAPWYLAHLRTPGWSVAGASFVGGPAFPSGHNGTMAWGITAGCSDTSDLVWEELDVAADTVRGPHGPEPLERLRETIRVRGRPDHVEEVLVTPRGPVVSPILDDLPMALALRATWLETVPVRGLIDVHRCTDAASFRAAFDAWPGPALNVVFAHRDGPIGRIFVGAHPRRRVGSGLLPAPAWLLGGGWEASHVDPAALPAVLDPPDGRVVSANDAPRSDAADPPFLGLDWLDGYRAARIRSALEAGERWTVAATAALQTDVTSVPWTELRELVLRDEAADPDARVAQALLRTWDGRVSASSSAAAVFEASVAALAEAFAREAAPRAWATAIGGGIGEALPRTLFGATTVGRIVAWLRSHGDTASVVEAGLAAGIARLRAAAGDDLRSWAWGAVRPLRLRHVLSASRPLDRLLNVGPVPVGGDTNTVAQAGVRPLDPFANPAAIANHRMVVDLGDVERSRYVLAGGQSGNPVSPHYADLFEVWRRGDGVPIPWSADAVAAATVDRLTLEPISAR